MNKSQKKSFVLYHDLCEVFSELTNEQAGVLIKEIVDYSKSKTQVNPRKPTGLSGIMNALFTPFKNHIDRDLEKYERTVERNKNNGKKGGRPKLKTQKTQANPVKADNDNDNDNDNEILKLEFETIWNSYGRRGSKKKGLERYLKLSDKDRDMIKNHYPSYVASRELKYRKYIEAYISDRLFESEVEHTPTKEEQQAKLEQEAEFWR